MAEGYPSLGSVRRSPARFLVGSASIAALLVATGARGQALDVVASSGGPTTVAVQSGGANAVVTTSRVVNGTGFNRFDHFNIGTGQTATLVLPNGSNNLVNLIRDPSTINGTVSSVLGTVGGQIGGNVFLVVPSGLIIGSTGVINTGRLIVRGTPANAQAGTDPSLSDVFGGASAASVTVNGRISAPGGVDIHAKTVTVGASGLVETSAAGFARLGSSTDLQNSLVSTQGLPSGQAIVTTASGGIAIVADSAITLAGPVAGNPATPANEAQPGALFDARPSLSLPAGISLTAPSIDIGGRLTAWDGTASGAAGAVSLIANDTEVFANTFSPAALFYGMPQARAGISVEGAIAGGGVSIVATAFGSTNQSDSTGSSSTLDKVASKLGSAALTKLAGAFGSGISAFVSLASANATVTVGNSAKIASSGDLTITAGAAATSVSTASAKSMGDTSGGAAIAASVSQLTSKSAVTIGNAQGGASLSAGGALTIGATSDPRASVDVKVTSTGTAISAGVAYNEVNSDAGVSVAVGSALDGKSIAISATTAQADTTAGVQTTATGFANNTSPGGGVAAVTEETIHSHVDVAGTVGSARTATVAITAGTTTSVNKTSATTTVGTDTSATSRSVPTSTTDLTNLLGGLLKLSTDDPAKTPTPGNIGASLDPANHAGAAVAVLQADEAATARITGTITASGQVSVAGQVHDSQVRNNAQAGVASAAKINGAGTSIGGAAAWGTYVYTGTADIGGTVNAGSLAVNSLVDRPVGIADPIGTLKDQPGSVNTPDNFNSVIADLGYAKSLASTLGSLLPTKAGVFGSYAGASADSDSAGHAAIGGSIAYDRIDSTSTAWIDPGAKVTIAGSQAAASTVDAETTVTMLNLSGPKLFGVKSAGAAVGGAITYDTIDPTTVAGIGDGVVFSAPNAGLTVNARAAIAALTLAPVSGKGQGTTASGAFAVNQIQGKTHAIVSDLAQIALGSGAFQVQAASDLQVWALAGTLVLNKADGSSSGTDVSVGVSGALNYITLETAANVAAAHDEFSVTSPAIAAAANAGITSGNVSVTAQTTGSINVISVAGTRDSNNPVSTPSFVGKLKTWYDAKKGALGKGIADALANVVAGSLGSAGFQKYEQQLNANYASRTDAANPAAAASGASAQQAPATSGWGVAGSASINLTTLGTSVNISKATFARDPAATSATFLAQATERADTVAVTGGAALANGATYSSGSTLIAGAYGVTASTDATTVTLDQSAITGFDALSANAAAKGIRIGAGLALAADTTQTSDGQILSSSASLILATDTVGVAVTDGSLTGSGKGDLSLLAYDGRTIGAGAGGLSWGSQNAFGAALTLILDKPASGTGTSAVLARTPVGKFVNLSVQALDAARLVGVAAAGALSAGADQSKGGLAASVSINDIAMGTRALIDLGTSGKGAINVTGAVTVASGEYAANDPARQDARTGCTTSCDAGETLLGNYAVGSGTFTAGDPVQASDLPSGAAIISVAVPVATAGGTTLGVGLSVNMIANDRTAMITGGAGASGATVTAGSVNVQTVDRATILSLGVGLAGSDTKTGIIGSLGFNQITSRSTAAILRSSAAASGPVLAVGSSSGAVAPVTVNALADGRIYSLSGAIGYGKSGAGGLAISDNDIVYTGSGSTPGLSAAVDGVALQGNPGLAVNAASTETIVSAAVAGTAAHGTTIAGSASINAISPGIVARADQISYAQPVTGDIAITASDSASIRSLALSAALSTEQSALGAAVSTNQIGTVTLARLTPGSSLSVGNLLVQSQSAATTQVFAVGLGLANKFGGAGSIAVNQTSAEADALVTLNGFTINASGSVGVLATRDSAIDAAAGAVALGSNSAVGASLVLNDVTGGASAQVYGNGGATINALGGGAGFSVRTGDLATALGEFDLPQLVPETTSTPGAVRAALQKITPTTTTVHGVAINASSTHATRTLAITGAVGGGNFGAAVTAVVGNVGGTTSAGANGVQFNIGHVSGSNPVAEPVSLDVRASTDIDTASFAGAGAAAGKAAVGAPVVSDGLTAQTTALVVNSGINTTGTMTVRAATKQTATALSLAGAVGGSAGAAVTGVSPRFSGVTTAAVDDPKMVSILGSGGLAVNADSDSRAYAAFGSIAAGNGAGAGAAVVVTNDDQAVARYRSTTRVAVTAPKVAVTANGRFDARVAGASVAGGVGGALVGNGVGIVNRAVISAQAAGLSYANPNGAVTITANQIANFQPIVGQLAATASIASGAGSLGAVVVLSQAKVDATLIDPLVTAGTVSVNAYGATGVDALQLGVAAGLGGSIGANVTYIGIGEVQDTGALFAGSGSDNANSQVAANAGSNGKSNGNLTMLAGGSGETTAQSAATPGLAQLSGNGATHLLTGAEGTRNASGTVQASSRDQFAQINTVAATPSADDAAASRVRAQVLSSNSAQPSKVAAGSLVVVSNANLVSKSSNFQGSAGLAAGSAAIAITRNAANSIARIGPGVTATGTSAGSAARIEADTGQDASRLTGGITNPSKAAEALVVAGAVGGLTASIGLADIKLQTVAVAENDGAIGFGTTTIKSVDTGDAVARVYGAAAGAAGALNVAVAEVEKDSTVASRLAGGSLSTVTNVVAFGGGSTTAYALAASGGNLFDGNGAVALATDQRTVDAQIAEGATVTSQTVLVDASAQPLVSAQSDGIAISAGVAMGASIATANAAATVESRIGEGAHLACPGMLTPNCTLTVRAALSRPGNGDNVIAHAMGSAGGGLAAANASVANAFDNGVVVAAVGADLNGSAGAPTVLAGPQLTILASRTLSQNASADGVTAAGLLSLGAQIALAKSSGSVDAGLLNVDGSNQVLVDPATNRALVDANGAFLRNPDATISSSSLDLNTATVRAGAGALGAGVAADARTVSGGTVTTTIAPDAANTFRAGTLTATALSQTDYRAVADATQASLLGGSGSTTVNTVDTTAQVLIGQAKPGAATGTNSTIRASRIIISAQNTVGVTGSDGGTARGAGGGAAAGAAANVTNRVNQHATVAVADGAILRQYGDASQNQQAMTINAGITTARSQSTSLEVGGAMLLPFARVDSTYNVAALVSVGANALLRGDGGIGIGTTIQQTLADTAAVQIYGLAGIGGGSASTTTNATGTVTVADGAVIESLSDVHLTPGISGDGLTQDGIAVSDQTDVFNQTALPISINHDAHATANIANSLVIGKALVRSARDVTLSALGQNAVSTAVGTGHNPYLSLFGKTDTGGTADVAMTGSIALNGSTVIAGFLAHRTISISDGANGGFNAQDSVNDGNTTLTRFLSVDGTGKITSDTLNSSAGGTIAAPDPDRLGQVLISARNVSALDVINQQISSLSAQVAASGLTVPVDPNSLSGADRTAAATALSGEAGSSALVAKLSAAFDTRAAILASGSPTTAGVEVDNVFAAGGSIAFNTGTITGAGAQVIANASPTIAITNLSANNLILGNLFIPAKPSGAVTYGGPAGETNLATVATVQSASATDTVEGLITVQNGQAFGSKSDVLVFGPIANVGGTLHVDVNTGNFNQFGDVQVGKYDVVVPNGLFNVSTDGAFTMGVPINLYYGRLGLTLNNAPWSQNCTSASGDGCATDPNQLALLVQSYIAEKALGVTDVPGIDALRQALKKQFGLSDSQVADPIKALFEQGIDYTDATGNRYFVHVTSDGTIVRNPVFQQGNNPNSTGGAGSGATIFASCSNWCELESNDNQLSSADPGSGQYIPFLWPYGDTPIRKNYPSGYYTQGSYFTDPVLTRSLTDLPENGNAANAVSTQQAQSDGGMIRANQVLINAKFVNISGSIVAGPEKQRSLTIANALTSSLQTIQDAMASDPNVHVGSVSAPLQTLGIATGNIGARYVVTGLIRNGPCVISSATGCVQQAVSSTTGYIQVDDVDAGAGGVINITGRILNTNPFGGGELKVLDGFANISIVNNASLDLHLGQLNAGTDGSGTIKLTDLHGDGTVETTVYKDVPGQGVTLSHTMSLPGTSVLQVDPDIHYDSATQFQGENGNPLIYDPSARGAAYFVTTETRTIVRDTSVSDGSVPTPAGYSVLGGAASPWRYGNPTQQPQGGTFVDLGAPNADPNLIRAVNGGTPAFVQTVSGTVTDRTNDPVPFGTNDEFRQIMNWEIPKSIDVTLTTAVRATYPIKVSFDSASVTGGVSIVSNTGNVVVGGRITYGGGDVDILAASNIGSTSSGLIYAHGFRGCAGGSSIDTCALSTTTGGSIGSATQPLAVTIAGSTFGGASSAGVQIGGSVTAQANGGDVYLALGSSTATAGDLDAVAIASVVATGKVAITSTTGLVGLADAGAANVVGTRIDLDAAGSIGGISYSGSGSDPLKRPAMGVTVGTGGLWVNAGGDVTIQGYSPNGPADVADVLRLGSIVATRDVQIRAPGSIVALDSTAIVNQDALARFLASAKALQLTPAANCTGTDCTLDPGKLAAITSDLRNQARAAYDTLIHANGLGSAEAQDLVGRINQLNTLAASGVSIARNGVVVYNPAQDSTHAAANFAATLTGKTGTLSTADITSALQGYANGVIAVVGTRLPTLSGTAAAQAAAVSALVQAQGKTAAETDALGKLQLLDQLRAQGVQIDASGKVTLAANANVSAGGALATIAVEALQSQTNALKPAAGTAAPTPISAPTPTDVLNGLQAYVDSVTGPIKPLFGGKVPTLAGLDTPAAQLTFVDSQIVAGGLATYTKAQATAATATLVQDFGTVPTSRLSIDTLSFTPTFLAARTDGATWKQTQLDFQVPSTAFVPVANTQFETRKPVITAHSLTLVAGNSIGNFEAPQQFRFTSAGLVDANGNVITDPLQKQLAAAYLASAGPGDLSATVTGSPPTQVTFTSRHDQPLPINVDGVVNAFAATTPYESTAWTPDNANILAGDIFLNDVGTLTIGSIVSLKPVTGPRRSDCNINPAALPSSCDSRIRLTADAILGVTAGAAQLNGRVYVNGLLTHTQDTDPAGRAVIMGGQVRLEASGGNLESVDGSAIQVDANALETLRAAGDIRLVRRAPQTIASRDYANPLAYANGTDLTVGDVFAGGTFALYNPVGSLLAGAVPSTIASENRNARIVAGVVDLRAAGDIGGSGLTAAGLPARFDIQTPRLDQLVAGWDATQTQPQGAPANYVLPGNATHNFTVADFLGTTVPDPYVVRGITITRLPDAGNLVLNAPTGQVILQVGQFLALSDIPLLSYVGARAGPTSHNFGYQVQLVGALATGTPPAYSPAGSAWITLRGASQIGGGPASQIAARGSIDIAQASAGAGLVDLESAVQVGGKLTLATAGDVKLGAGINVNGTGQPMPAACSVDPTQASCLMDLSRLLLTVGGAFNFSTGRSIEFGSLAANGGTVESTLGSITIDGALNGAANSAAPFALKGKTGVFTHDILGGALALTSSNGRVDVAGVMRASSITMQGAGTVGVDGAIDTQNLVIDTVGDVTLENTIVADSINVHATGGVEILHSITFRSPPGHTVSSLIGGGEITLGQDAVLSGTPQTRLILSGSSLAFDPTSVIRGLDTTLIATSGPATLGTIEGGALNLLAQGDIALGRLATRSAVIVSQQGGITFGGPVAISAGRLDASAATAIAVNAPMSAFGGIALSAPLIAGGSGGSLTDQANPGAPITLRADRIDLSLASAAGTTGWIKLDVAGYSGMFARDVKLTFDTDRPIDFGTIRAIRLRIDANGHIAYAPWTACETMPVVVGSWFAVAGGAGGRCSGPVALDPVEGGPPVALNGHAGQPMQLRR